MKDLVVKTVLFTLAFILGIVVLVFGALAIFTPITLAEVFDGTGGYSASIHFYQKNYEKTGEIEDLALLALKINQDVDGDKAEKYLEKLVSDAEFVEFCKTEVGGELSNKQFYIGKYASVLVLNGKFDKALEVAESFVTDNDYTALNPYSVILIERGESLSEAELNKIKDKIKDFSEAHSDLDYIDELLNK